MHQKLPQSVDLKVSRRNTFVFVRTDEDVEEGEDGETIVVEYRDKDIE